MKMLIVLNYNIRLCWRGKLLNIQFVQYKGKLSMFAGTFMEVCNTGQLLTKLVEFVSVTEITFQLLDLN